MTDQTKDQQDVGETTSNLEEALEKGFLGTHQDPEPNEKYTIAGVTGGNGGASEQSAPAQSSSPPSSGGSSSKGKGS
jgi:hypothetical protein